MFAKLIINVLVFCFSLTVSVNESGNSYTISKQSDKLNLQSELSHSGVLPLGIFEKESEKVETETFSIHEGSSPLNVFFDPGFLFSVCEAPSHTIAFDSNLETIRLII
ncbi:hypothetical protein [Leptospira sarikeiensis]|uniref:TIGR04452 family lipoprotein n=1 Tax=Leptospira sarikeiensis TaxID=2484943 RepID=A0A4R9KCF1_9LEPT|nr:hypothetical protein [Leptospira sarikeiensis]TGL63575.1 hypothetical protein EHQ64_06385 [Leptospira sarikeiensis]